jgi:hypothetical protein
MLIAWLFGLGWIALACLVARVVTRFMRAGADRERSLPRDPEDRIAWIRGDQPDDGEPVGVPPGATEPAQMTPSRNGR